MRISREKEDSVVYVTYTGIQLSVRLSVLTVRFIYFLVKDEGHDKIFEIVDT